MDPTSLIYRIGMICLIQLEEQRLPKLSKLSYLTPSLNVVLADMTLREIN